MDAVLSKPIVKLVVFFCALWQLQAVHAKEVLPEYGAVELQGKFEKNSQSFSLKLRCEALASQRNPSQAVHGTDDSSLRCQTTSLVLRLNGRDVRLPTEFFNDLGNVHIPLGVWLSRKDDYLVIHIGGGDGAGSYKARIFVERLDAVFREIDEVNESGEMRTIRDVDKTSRKRVEESRIKIPPPK